MMIHHLRKASLELLLSKKELDALATILGLPGDHDWSTCTVFVTFCPDLLTDEELAVHTSTRRREAQGADNFELPF